MWDQDTAPKRPIDLSRFNEVFRNEPDPPAFTPVPDGRYQVEVDDVELAETAATGNPVLKWALRITGGAHAHRILFKRRVITGKTIRFLKTELKVCGVDLPEFSDLPSHLDDMKGLCLEVVKKTNGDWVDIYFENRLEALPNPSDDDLPF